MSEQHALRFTDWPSSIVKSGYYEPRDSYLFTATINNERIWCFVHLDVLECHFPGEKPWKQLSAASTKKLHAEFNRLARNDEFHDLGDPLSPGRRMLVIRSLD